ncbi:hypothetical protein [Vreelandella massiliensis]|uniref:hypothetical protein n=1 Tax=Vreelandella massiliensis TaxID=1816686 RepID=UPI00096A8B59|nr:hypothetical protein [Halomonas massiliensis]
MPRLTDTPLPVLDLAQLTERLGFIRFWMAEHQQFLGTAILGGPETVREGLEHFPKSYEIVAEAWRS